MALSRVGHPKAKKEEEKALDHHRISKKKWKGKYINK